MSETRRLDLSEEARMRNTRRAGRREHTTELTGAGNLLLPVIVASCLAASVCGCGPTGPTPKEQLTTAYRDLDQRRYDDAFAAAAAFLSKNPTGPGSAEALYLQGRVYDARAEATGNAGRTDEARAQLTAAANAYLQALHRTPPPPVEGLAHAGLANAAFHLDDYPTAVREWGLAYPLVRQPDAKAWVLFRLGLCQQRLGWFEMADRTFAQVQREFPGDEPAARAGARIGQRAFYVQVGAFASPNNADREIARLRALRLEANRGTDPATGRQIVRVGPFTTYAEARAAQARLAGAFPDAVLVP